MGAGGWRLPLLACTALVAGCAAETPPLPPAPDLAALDAPVQAQYRERRAALEKALGRRDATAGERAEAFGALGQWYHAYMFYDGARATYEAARSLAPEDPRWPYYLAHVARATSDPETSRGLLERVLELDSEHLPATVWLAETDWEAGRTAPAVAGFDAALARDPRCVRALAGRARATLAEGRPGAAVEIYKAAMRLQPKSASLRYSLGVAYRQLGDLKRAAAELARVPEENREHVPLWLDDPWMNQLEILRQGVNAEQVLGRRALDAGRYEEAAEHFRRAVAADPATIEARINLALALDQGGRLVEAEAAAADAVATDPTFARARVVLASILLKQQRFDDARQQLQAAVDADPEHEKAHYNLAQLLRGQGRLEEALGHYARVRELDPRIAMAGHGHAVTLLWLGRPAAARAALDEDLARLPGDRDLTLLLARLLAAAPEASTRDGARALELADGVSGAEPTLAGAETLAMAHAELGRFADAVAWQQAALATARASGRRQKVRLAERRLDLYRRSQPCREPWGRGEAPSTATVTPPGR